MANIRNTAATSALNEDDYINELYDTNQKKQETVLKDNYDRNAGVLDQSQNHTQEQTGEYLTRTDVEAKRQAELYGDGGLSEAAQAQVRLQQDNAQQRNASALRQTQADLDAEFQRQRQLLASQYETEIRKAQADNDMERAQALYEAAKAEEAQLLELQKQGAALVKQVTGSDSGYDNMAKGYTLDRNTTGKTWKEVRRDEDAVNAIYDAQLESLKAELEGLYNTGVSDLQQRQQEREKQTDENLTKAYVEAMQGRKNRGEMAAAYGQGTGTAAQGQLAGDLELLDTLTGLRTKQQEADGAFSLEGLELSREYGQGLYDAQHDTDLARAMALYEAAEENEQELVGKQLFVGKERAEDGNYTMLGKLYGLTDKRIESMNDKKKSGAKNGGTHQSGERNPYGMTDAEWEAFQKRLASAEKTEEARTLDQAHKDYILAENKARAREKARGGV